VTWPVVPGRYCREDGRSGDLNDGAQYWNGIRVALHGFVPVPVSATQATPKFSAKKTPDLPISLQKTLAHNEGSDDH
jgi:hypothetical protein